ncbi:MAG: DUF1552 domain-containing protein [Acidobacteriota bacterium]|nr:DUF1552 domain-containing protein [Acidobacteriota bacterium]
MFITGKRIPRRTFLRDVGTATLALPFLDAMRPAGRISATTAASLDPTRLVCIEMVHGAAGSNAWGATQHLWSPATTGRTFDLGSGALSSLEPYRDYLTIISNTDVGMAEAFSPPEIGGDHFRTSSVFLTQAHPKQTQGSDVLAGTSLDQVHAQRFGQETPIPSMQLCIENVDQAGGCAYGYTCVYTDSISWAAPTEPLPVTRSPRVAFEQLFGVGGTAEERAARRRTDASILDWMTTRVAQLKRELGPVDRARMEQYLDNIREIERRIQLVEERNLSGEPRELPAAPAGVPDSFDEHVKLMFDVQALAFESDVTRVFSLKMGRDASGRVYPLSGTDKPFHSASHHGGNEDAIVEFSKINRYHVSLLPYFLDKLKNTMEGDTHLLHKSAILYGSGMGDPNLHNHKRCPLMLLGHANGKLKGGLHVEAADGTPMANAMLSLLRALGHDDRISFGDSTGELSLSI